MISHWVHLGTVLASDLAGETGERGFGLNPDLFETNLVNIVIILGVLIYAGRGLVGKILQQRRQAIETAIADAETRKQGAMGALAEQQQRLAQTQVECERLLAQATEDAKRAREEILADVDRDIARLREAAEREIASEQRRVGEQLRRQAVEQALVQVAARLAQGVSPEAQHQLLNRSIAALERGADS
ncbi:MAG TPA: F0F1 ATP synthase subunit B [Cyanobacteria bacterium UBA8156]|jgi:F-type H+-transporting ATPase subunit b|nr:F0F1 ATP synthase subunit B [Cyanobacteria bacterium UBA8156]